MQYNLQENMISCQMTQKPPVPKFDIARQPRLNSPSSSTPKTTNSKKRMSNIFQELSHQLYKMDSQFQNSDVEKLALLFLTPQVLNMVKSKKYSFIAEVALTHAIGTCQEGKILRQFMDFSIQKAEVTKILLQLHKEHLINASYLVHSKLGQVNLQLGLNEKFSEVCDQVEYILTDIGFYNPVENTNLSVAAIIKIAGDIVFMQKGGIKIEEINSYCTCPLQDLRIKLDKIRPFSGIIFQKMYNKYKESNIIQT